MADGIKEVMGEKSEKTINPEAHPHLQKMKRMRVLWHILKV